MKLERWAYGYNFTGFGVSLDHGFQFGYDGERHLMTADKVYRSWHINSKLLTVRVETGLMSRGGSGNGPFRQAKGNSVNIYYGKYPNRKHIKLATGIAAE